jgi:hypothetical protein
MATSSATCITPVRAKGRKKQRRLGQGVRIQTQTKLVVMNVYNYFDEQRKKNPKNPGYGVFDKTLQATGLVLNYSEILITNISKALGGPH